MEYREFRDDPHLPEDAGEYAEELTDILNRIPIGWGKWISCDKGWYKIIVETNQKLRFLYPTYEIHQIKEKFGTLRYYYGIPYDESNEVDSLVYSIMADVASNAENRSAYYCEVCGSMGRTRERNYWYKTLCKDCAVENDYPLEDWEEKKYASTD